MRRRTRALGGAALAGALVATAGCGLMEDQDASGVGATVDVATPHLERVRDQVGLDPCPEGAGAPSDRPDALPDLTLPCLGGGQAVNLATLRGPTVITVWAQWCGPCREELPIFQQLADSGTVDVLGINYLDTQPEAALRLLQEKGVTFPSVADPGTRLKESYPWLTGLPLLMMVDSDGSVAYSEFTEIASYEELEGLVGSELGITP
ncbi:TlpA family protein disulfide reductase [Nocardioidaceae bacterium]|nr:TlpA family protein disulfide reductase [Nocardioidaceae bacterium]